MGLRQVGFRPHLDQAGGGAFEFLSLKTLLSEIELIRLGGRRGDQLYVHVIECVDQDDEALGGVARIEIHHRNVVENDGVILMRDAQIIGSGERLFAQIVK